VPPGGVFAQVHIVIPRLNPGIWCGAI